MGIDTEKYIRKPLYVDAVRVTAQNFDEVAAWCQGKVESEGSKKFIRVRVAFAKDSRQTKAFVGDWVLWTEHGGYKVYLNNAFRKAFDRVKQERNENGNQNTFTPSTPIEDVRDIESEVKGELRDKMRTQIGQEIESGTPQVQDTPTSPPQPVISEETGGRTGMNVESRRVLTEAEQQGMSSEEVRELLRSGDVVLAQDVAQA